MAKTKALISFAVNAKLICVFVFAYANCWFSHAKAQLFLISFHVYQIECVCCRIYTNFFALLSIFDTDDFSIRRVSAIAIILMTFSMIIEPQLTEGSLHVIHVLQQKTIIH